MPSFLCRSSSSTCMSSRSFSSSAPSGSSSSRIAGLVTQRAGERHPLALAAAQLMDPPRVLVGEPDQRQRLPARSRRSATATPRTFRPYSTFSPTDMCGNSA